MTGPREPVRDNDVPSTQRPLLASEALMDDLAPIEPWGTTARLWAAAMGAVFAAQGLGPSSGASFRYHGDAAFALGGITVAAAVIPISYRLRAGIMVFLAATIGLLGLTGHGPAHALADAIGEWGLLHLLAATGLPAALLFRARYRAYSGARTILIAALILALPFVGYCVWRIATAELWLQIAAAVAMGAVAVSLLGFMGSETTVAGNYLAASIIVAITIELGAGFAVVTSADTVGQIWGYGSVAAFAGAAALGAFGGFQLLASRHWSHARSVRLTRDDTARPSSRGLTDTWSSHE